MAQQADSVNEWGSMWNTDPSDTRTSPVAHVGTAVLKAKPVAPNADKALAKMASPGWWNSTEMSEEDRVLLAKMTITQAIYRVLYESNPRLAEGLVTSVAGFSVKDLRAFSTLLMSALTAMDSSTVFPAYQPLAGLEMSSISLAREKLKNKTSALEVFVLPYDISRVAMDTLIGFSSELPVKTATGITFSVVGQGKVPLVYRGNLTDEIVNQLLEVLSLATGRKYVSVPLKVESFLKLMFVLQPTHLASIAGGQGKYFEELPLNPSSEKFRKLYAPAEFHTGGVLAEFLVKGINEIRRRLNTVPVPPGASTSGIKNLVYQACYQVHRLRQVETLTKIAEAFYGKFEPVFANAAQSLADELRFLRTLPIDKVPSRETVNARKNASPTDALDIRYRDQQFRALGIADQVADHLTQNNPFADQRLGGASKIASILAQAPPPPGGMIVIGESIGHDRHVWPAGTAFYDLKPNTSLDIVVKQLDVNDAKGMAAALNGAKGLFSDVCVNLPNTVDLKKVKEQCAFQQNYTVLRSLCSSIMGCSSLVWVGLKMFLPYENIAYIPPCLAPLLERFQDRMLVLKPGKAHSDEFYLVLSHDPDHPHRSLPVKNRGYWSYGLFRVAQWVAFGNYASLVGLANSNNGIYATPEAAIGWAALKSENLPFTLPKGAGFKAVVQDDNREVLNVMWEASAETDDRTRAAARIPLPKVNDAYDIFTAETVTPLVPPTPPKKEKEAIFQAPKSPGPSGPPSDLGAALKPPGPVIGVKGGIVEPIDKREVTFAPAPQGGTDWSQGQ